MAEAEFDLAAPVVDEHGQDLDDARHISAFSRARIVFLHINRIRDATPLCSLHMLEKLVRRPALALPPSLFSPYLRELRPIVTCGALGPSTPAPVGWATQDLAHNELRSLPPRASWASLPHLSTLYLHHNRVSTLASLVGLAGCPRLTILTLFGNPVARSERYRPFVVNSVRLISGMQPGMGAPRDAFPPGLNSLPGSSPRCKAWTMPSSATTNTSSPPRLAGGSRRPNACERPRTRHCLRRSSALMPLSPTTLLPPHTRDGWWPRSIATRVHCSHCSASRGGTSLAAPANECSAVAVGPHARFRGRYGLHRGGLRPLRRRTVAPRLLTRGPPSQAQLFLARVRARRQVRALLSSGRVPGDVVQREGGLVSVAAAHGIELPPSVAKDLSDPVRAQVLRDEGAARWTEDLAAVRWSPPPPPPLPPPPHSSLWALAPCFRRG